MKRDVKHAFGFGLFILLNLLLGQPVQAFVFGEFAEGIDIHGFTSQGFLKSYENSIVEDSLDGTFQFNEMGLTLSTDLSPHLHAGLQLFSRDFGEYGNNNIQVDWAYGDYRWKDWLGIRAGKVKLSLGLYNDMRDIDSVRTWIFLPESIYDERDRETLNALYGIEGYGYIFLKSFGSLDYQIQYGERNLTDSGLFADECSQEDDMLSIKSEEIKNVLTLGLNWETPVEGLRIKGWVAQYDILAIIQTAYLPELVEAGLPVDMHGQIRYRDNRYHTLSLEYSRNSMTLMAEYATDKETDEERTEGYYLGATFCATDRVQVGTYYSVFYEDVNDRDGSAYEAEGYPDYLAWYKDFTVTVRVDFNESWIVKIEGHAANGAASLWQDINPDGFEENTYLLAVKTTFNF